MQRFLNNYETTLALGINDTVNAIHVYPSTAFDDVSTLTGGDYYLLTISDGTNIEIVKVTEVSEGPINILTVERDVSASGHGAFAFAAGASVKMSVVAETLQALNEVLLNADYPPNYTVNVQTRSTAGTVAVPFTPLVIQQVNIDVASGVTLNVTPGATWGECIITLYRTNLSHSWPSLTYNGTAVPVAGDPPGSGNYNAKLLCRSEPGSGSLPNPFVTFEWVTRDVAASASYQSAFGTDPVSHGLIYAGNTLVINPLSSGMYHSASFQSGTTLDIFPSPPGTKLIEVFVKCENAGGFPAVRLFGGSITPAGGVPASGTKLLHVIIDGNSFNNSYAEWLAYNTVLSLPFTSERIIEHLNMPTYGAGFASTLTINYSGGPGVETSRMARFVSGASIDFVYTGVADDAAWSGVRELFVVIYATTTAMPTVKHNGVTITPSGTAPAIIPPPVFPATVGPPAGMLKATIMMYEGWKKIKAEWVVFQ